MDSAEEDHYGFTAMIQIFSQENKTSPIFRTDLSSELLLCSHKILLGVVSRVQQTSLSRSLTTITCSNYKRQVPITHSLIYYITTSTGKNGDTTTNKLLAIIKSNGQQPLPSSPPARSLYSRFLQFTTNHQLDTYSKQNITIESASR